MRARPPPSAPPHRVPAAALTPGCCACSGADPNVLDHHGWSCLHYAALVRPLPALLPAEHSFRISMFAQQRR